MLSAILSCIAAPAAYAQKPTPGWEGGTVEVSTSSLSLKPGESVSYSLRLTRQPTADDWFVRVFVDGVVWMDGEYDANGDGDVDIKWVPSVGWEFDLDNWDQWRTINVRVEEKAPSDLSVRFDHDVWDHTDNCPVHQVGVVTVTRGSDVTVTVSSSGGGGDDGGGDDGGGDDGGGDDGGGDDGGVSVRTTGRDDGSRADGGGDDGGGDDGGDDGGGDDNGGDDDGGDDAGGGTAGSSQKSYSGPEVFVSFDSESYSVAEGESVPIELRLSEEPEREVTVELSRRHKKGVGSADYSGLPKSITFAADEAEKSFDFAATQDAVVDDGEQVLLRVVRLPDGVRDGTPSMATVEILDVPSLTVSFKEADYEVTEGDSVQVTVRLTPVSATEVQIPLTAEPGMGAEAADYSGIPPSVTFAPEETEQSFYLQAAADEEADDGETVVLGFGTLPAAVAAGDPATATVTLQDPVQVPVDPVEVEVSFDQVALGGFRGRRSGRVHGPSERGQ